MKTTCILIILLSSVLIASNNDSLRVVKFGIAATLEKSNSVYWDGFHSSTHIGFSKILLPIIFKSQIKIMPEIGLQSYKNRQTTDYTLWQLGLGIYYFHPYKDINIYTGPRAGLEKLKLVLSGDDTEESITYYNLGITIGAEYFLSENFSFGCELQAGKYFSDDYFNIEISDLTFIQMLYLSFYLK